MKLNRESILGLVVFLLIEMTYASLAQAGPFEDVPVQTINYDFGSGGAYIGDNGVLSSPGGTHWNTVPASAIQAPFLGGVSYLDEFGGSTRSIVFSFLGTWVDASHPTYFGPRSDGIQAGQPTGATVTLGRVLQFEEMVIYYSTDFVGGFSACSTCSTIQVPLTGNSLSTIFPGIAGFDYLHITDVPPIGGGLGEAPTITIVLPDNISTIEAIQIRGKFGVPEPASFALLLFATCGVGCFRAKRNEFRSGCFTSP